MQITSRVQLIELMKHRWLPLHAAEVGVAEGIFSTELLSLGLHKLYLIDIWETVPFIDGCASFEQEWHNKNFEDVCNKFRGRQGVVILKGFSYKMALEIRDESLGLVYIDGDHSFHGCRADIHSFWPKLTSGGIMAFHDYGNVNYGVNRAVQQFAHSEGLEIFELPEDGNIDYLGAYFIKK